MTGASEGKQAPIHDTPILGMKMRPRVSEPVEYGGPASWWVEYPSGLMDLTRSMHLGSSTGAAKEGRRKQGEWDIPVDGDRTIRVDARKSALAVVDMQKFVFSLQYRV
jgi:hypothetical protein